MTLALCISLRKYLFRSLGFCFVLFSLSFSLVFFVEAHKFLKLNSRARSVAPW